MKNLLRSLFVLAFVGIVVAGCSKEEEEVNTLKVGDYYTTKMTSCTLVKYPRSSTSNPYNIEARICTGSLTVKSDGEYEGSGDVLALDLYSLEPDLKPGTYTCKSSSVAGSLHSAYSHYQSYTNGIKSNDGTTFSSGTAEVKNISGGYEIVFNLTRHDGSIIKGTYSGETSTIGRF